MDGNALGKQEMYTKESVAYKRPVSKTGLSLAYGERETSEWGYAICIMSEGSEDVWRSRRHEQQVPQVTVHGTGE